MSVYYARNAAGKCYVGITNDFARRVAQHDGRFELIAQLEVNLTRGQARWSSRR
jgi:predicted GIY-YIG superfamily endonuclease